MSRRLSILLDMPEPDNTLADFPAETFTIMVFCDKCGHSSALAREKVPTKITVRNLGTLLRCSCCGSREASVRIIYSAAGGFRYGAG